METVKYKDNLSFSYKGEKINELISIDKQIKELENKRRTLSRELYKETVMSVYPNFPICGFLYYNTWETKLVKNSENFWSAAHRRRTGKKVQDVRLAFLSWFEPFEHFSDTVSEKEIKYYPTFRSVGSDNRPGNEFSTSTFDSMEFEPLGDMTIDEAKKLLKKIKKDIKKEESDGILERG